MSTPKRRPKGKGKAPAKPRRKPPAPIKRAKPKRKPPARIKPAPKIKPVAELAEAARRASRSMREATLPSLPDPGETSADVAVQYRQQCKEAALQCYWQNLPTLSEQLVRCALSAMKPITSFGEVQSYEPDYYMRLRATEMIHEVTILPEVKRDTPQVPIFIFNAIEGAAGERLARAGFSGPLFAGRGMQRSVEDDT